MKFYSSEYVITKIKRRTKAKGFCDLKVGDELYFWIELKDTTGASGGHLYATEVGITLLNNGKTWRNSQNQFLKNIGCFELEEVI